MELLDSQLRLLTVFLLLASSTFAGPHPIHYLKTHKAVLAADLVDVGAMAAESYTSVQCLRDMRAALVVTSGCAKQGWEGLEIAPLFVFGNHMVWHFAPDSDSRYIFAVWTAPAAVLGVRFGLVNDANSSISYLQRAYPTNFHVGSH